MADEYDALEAAASSFVASADVGKSEHRSSRHREASPSHRSSRDERDHRDRDRRDRDRERGDRGDRDRDRERERRDRGDRGDRDRERGDRDRRERGGVGDRYEPDRRDRRPEREMYERPGGGRRGYEDEMGPPGGGRRRSPPPFMARGMRDDGPPGGGRGGGGDFYGGPPPMRDERGFGRDDRDGRGGGRGDRRGGGGGGRGRDEREPETGPFAAKRRSPTPEGALPLSERQRLGPTRWGERPPGFENVTASQAKQTGHFPAPGPNRQPIPPMFGNPGFPGAPGFHQVHPQPMSSGPMGGPAGAAGALGNPMRQSKRLYVGNIQLTCNEQILAEFFNEKMKEMGFAVAMPGEPVTSVQINHEKSYAFVEFRQAEEATSAMGFDGIIFQGNPLKLRRPKDYIGPESGGMGIYIPGVVSTTVADTPNKIYIGGLPSYLNDEQVMELLKSFGELKSFNLVKEGAGQTGPSKGFAFCEYVDDNVTDIAIQGLNGLQLADRVLLVQRASQGRQQQTSFGGAGPGMGGMGMGMGMGMGGMGGGGVPNLRSLAPNILGHTGGPAAPTSRVILMLNMVNADELVDQQDYEDILLDIREECEKYGPVEGLRIPRPAKREAKWNPGETAAQQKAHYDAIDEAAGVGKVWILMGDINSASRAIQQLAGRQFGGRTILTASVPEDEFFPPGEAPPPPPPAEE